MTWPEKIKLIECVILEDNNFLWIFSFAENFETTILYFDFLDLKKNNTGSLRPNHGTRISGGSPRGRC